jgi:hypothetical protein
VHETRSEHTVENSLEHALVAQVETEAPSQNFNKRVHTAPSTFLVCSLALVLEAPALADIGTMPFAPVTALHATVLEEPKASSGQAQKQPED